MVRDTQLASDGGTPDHETVLDSCPECGSTDELVRGDLFDGDNTFDYQNTVCRSCARVFDAFGDLRGGVNNDVAASLSNVSPTGTYECENCGDVVREPNASGEWDCVVCGGLMVAVESPL
jgi:Zn finger protein HypA/HybF involved in hydrogenase expression